MKCVYIIIWAVYFTQSPCCLCGNLSHFYKVCLMFVYFWKIHQIVLQLLYIFRYSMFLQCSFNTCWFLCFGFRGVTLLLLWPKKKKIQTNKNQQQKTIFSCCFKSKLILTRLKIHRKQPKPNQFDQFCSDCSVFFC